MSDIICTNCRGESTSGCWLCNPSFHAPLTTTFVCVGCTERDQRIAELEAKLDEIADEVSEGNICVCAEHKIDHIRHILKEQGDE